VLTADAIPLHHAEAMEAGAAAILSKLAHPDEIIAAIRRVAAGETLQPAQEIIELWHLAAAERARARDIDARLQQLTPREREVLALLAEGLDNRAIAEQLHISPETARAHVVNLLSKLNVGSRLQAAVFAIRHGIVSRHDTTRS
jgi:DNA-binding NarL/FixJ family response regulator